MKKLLLATVALASIGTASAATFPTNTTPPWKSYMATGNTADIVASTTVAAAIGTKVDATSGQSLNQTLETPTITGGTLTTTAMSGSLSIAGAGDMLFTPKGSPISGTVGSIVKTITMGHSGVQNFGDNTECTSTAIAPSNGGNVCDYRWIELQSGSGGGWAQSLVTQLDSGFDTSKYTATAAEMDLNNLAGDYGEFSSANSIGILLNGLGYQNTAAVSVQTGNSSSGTTGTSGQIPIWYYGLHFGASAVKEADVDTQSSAVYGWRGRGSHVFGASYADDNTTSGAIQLGDLGVQQGIIGRHGSTNYAMLYMASDGSMHVGSLAQANWQSDGNPLPTTDDTYSLGSSSNRWANVYTLNVNGVPTPASGTPTAGAACTPGEQQYDATKFYMCLTDSKWHTMATASD